MKKTIVRLLQTLALAVVALCVFAAPALAEDYKYTVRVFGGNQGTYDGEEVKVVGTFSEGEQCTLDISKVDLLDGTKYYPKGFRISGQDALAKVTFPVHEDMDFVVAYGVRGEMVEYTIRFVEATYQNGAWQATNRLLTNDAGVTSVTYEGKVGDKPVVAYSYVPGYRPLYENITGTLDSDPKKNVWDLPYVVVETQQQQQQQQQQQTTTETTETVVETTTTTTTTPTTTTTTTTPTTTPTTTETTVEGGGTEATTTEGTEGTPGETTGPVTETTIPVNTEETTPTEPPATQEIMDVDNPMASSPTGTPTTDTTPEPEPEPEKKSGFSTTAIAGGIALVIAAAAGAVYYILRKRNEDLDL